MEDEELNDVEVRREQEETTTTSGAGSRSQTPVLGENSPQFKSSIVQPSVTEIAGDSGPSVTESVLSTTVAADSEGIQESGSAEILDRQSSEQSDLKMSDTSPTPTADAARRERPHSESSMSICTPYQDPEILSQRRQAKEEKEAVSDAREHLTAPNVDAMDTTVVEKSEGHVLAATASAVSTSAIAAAVSAASIVTSKVETGGTTAETKDSMTDSATVSETTEDAAESTATSLLKKFPNSKNFMKKLSVDLLQTYRHINELYYAKKRRQMDQLSTQGKKTHSGNEWDEENGDYKIREGDVLNERYEIKEAKPLGKGSFGIVVKAYDLKEAAWVALKIIKNKRPFFEQAQIEKEILTKFRECGEVVMDKVNIVSFKDHFMHKQHQCLVFELLNLSLYDLVKRTLHQGVSLNLVRKFGKQILTTLQFLSHPSIGIIHCDLKPENILLRNRVNCQVKCIDFGSSCHLDRKIHTYIQSRFYRAPEVLLCLPYGHEVDMWSLGAILIEMHTGVPIFNGKDEWEQMGKIVEFIGLPPRRMLSQAATYSRIVKSFQKNADGNYEMTVHGRKIEPGSKKIRDVIGVDTFGPSGRRKGEAGHSVKTYERFLDLLEKIFVYEPLARIRPQEAAKHPFFTELEPVEPPSAPAVEESKTAISSDTVTEASSAKVEAAVEKPAMPDVQRQTSDVALQTDTTA